MIKYIVLPFIVMFIGLNQLTAESNTYVEFDLANADYRGNGYEVFWTIRDQWKGDTRYEAGDGCFKWDVEYLLSTGVIVPEYRQIDPFVHRISLRLEPEYKKFTQFHDWSIFYIITGGINEEEVTEYINAYEHFMNAYNVRINSGIFSDPVWCD